MKTRIFKIMLSLLILASTISYHTNKVYANEFILVSSSEIDLSEDRLFKPEYLNSPQIKEYLVQCIIKAGILSESLIQCIKEKLNMIEFFCMNSAMYDNEGRVLLRIWMPAGKKTGLLRPQGMLYTIPMQYM